MQISGNAGSSLPPGVVSVASECLKGAQEGWGDERMAPYHQPCLLVSQQLVAFSPRSFISSPGPTVWPLEAQLLKLLCLFPFLSPSLFCPVVVSFSGTWEAFCQTNHFTIMMDVWGHSKALLLEYLQLTFLVPHALGATDSWVFGQSGSQSEGQQCLCSQALKPVWGLLCTYLLPRFSLGFASGIVGTHTSMELATSTLTFLFLP